MEPFPSGPQVDLTPPTVDVALDEITQTVAEKARKLRGPVKTCRTCNRRHGSREPCPVFYKTVNTAGGGLRNHATTVKPEGVE